MILGKLTVKAVDTKGTPIKGATWSIVGQDIYTDMRAGRQADVKPGKWKIRANAEGYRRVERTVAVIKEKEEVVVFELMPSKAQLDGSKIEIKDEVHFATGSDVILEKSFPLLEEVSHILSDHPELTKIRIEGHTDNRGNDDMNMDLSQRRADSVKRYLEEHGVDSSRMEHRMVKPSRSQPTTPIRKSRQSAPSSKWSSVQTTSALINNTKPPENWWFLICHFCRHI